MTEDFIQSALAKISSESDPTAKHVKLASLVSGVFRERGVELVVVGGSAIEFYTEGAYVSGDIDLCLVSPPRLDVRTRQELMSRLDAQGGPRSWKVAGQYVDLLGEVETLAKSPFDKIEAPFGAVLVISPEDLIVERVLISIYPQAYEPAAACAKKLLAVALAGHIEVDWNEARRLAECPEYRIFPELRRITAEVANELGKSSPYHT
jgi:hypothetical protein